METGERTSTKKARVVESPEGQVKQEAEQRQTNGGGALVAVEGAAAKVEIMVRMRRAMLHCPLCALPFTPPIFQCGVGHLACGPCHGQLASNQCRSCDGAYNRSYNRCFVMDAFVSSAVVPCPHEAHGCRSEVAYYLVEKHRTACPYAPCACPEPGCAFVGSPSTLADHLAAAPHAWPVDKFRYGEVLRLRVPESEPQRLLVAEDDGRVFLLSACSGVSPRAIVPVTVACVGAAQAAGPTQTQYMCKMWANGRVSSVTGKVERVLMETEVPTSSGGARDAAANEHEAMFLGVPRKMLSGAAKQILLGVRINKVSSG